MDNTKKYEKSYNFILEYFTKERIVSRYVWLYDLLESFVVSNKLEEKVGISEDIVNHIIIDYFVDIYRLKDFQDIELTHDSKIYAYLSFWILRHKPLQILSEGAETEVFINEDFVAEFLRSYLFRDPGNVSILNEKKKEVDNFLETLLYYFKYRDYSAKNIEMIILAFQAGRGYQYSIDHEK